MHRNALGQPRADRVKQVLKNERSVSDYENYIPIGNASEKLNSWKRQDGEIIYLSSHQSEADVLKDKAVLKRYGFPAGEIFYRKNGERYGSLIEKSLPDILIEDDCESIGGEKEMIYPNLSPAIKNKIRSIVVKEFEGVDNLPDSLNDLEKIYGMEKN
jgi:hypothetical protein